MPSGPAQVFRLFLPVEQLQMRGSHCILPASPEGMVPRAVLSVWGSLFPFLLFSSSLLFWASPTFLVKDLILHMIHFLSFKYSIFSCWEFGGEKCVGCWAWAVLWSAMGVCELLQGPPAHFFPLFFSCLLTPLPQPPQRP